MTETSLKIDELILRPSVKSQFSNILFCFGLVFLSLRGLEYEGGVIYYAGKLSGGFAIFFALVVLVNIYNYRYLIAEDFVQATEGILALNMFTHKVKYRDIKLLETRKGILGRILNYGDVLIGSAATSQIEITLRGLSDPDLVKDFILKKISQKRNAEKTDNNKKEEVKVA